MSKLFLRGFFLASKIRPWIHTYDTGKYNTISIQNFLSIMYTFYVFFLQNSFFSIPSWMKKFKSFLHPGVMKQKQKKHEVFFKYELPMTWTGSRLLIEKESRNCFGTNIEIRFKHCKYVMVSETRVCSVK